MSLEDLFLQKRKNQINKHYLVLYLIFIGISIANLIQTGLALSTGMFIELNPLGYNWRVFLFYFLVCLYMLIPFFITNRGYKRAFLILIICMIFVSFGFFIHDFIVIKGR